MDRETMRLAILSAAREWREDDKKRIRPAKNIPANLKGRTFRLKPPEGGAASEGGEEAGDGKRGHGNTRLPYGLCKKYGIDVPPGTTPYEAWELLKGKGVNPKEEYRKLKERGEKKARREAEEQAKREAGEKAKREAGERARKEAEEKARREAEERAKREAEERAKHEAEEKAKREAEEKAKREAEEKTRKEAEEKARKEAEEKAGGETGAGAWPEPERVEPKTFQTPKEATAALHSRCGCPTDESWERGVCDDAKKRIAGAIVALDGRYHALEGSYNSYRGVLVADGNGSKDAIAAMSARTNDGVTTRLRFFRGFFSSAQKHAETVELVHEECKRGDKMPCAEGMETEYLAAHEYGHCVQQRLIRDTGVFPPGTWMTKRQYTRLADAAANRMKAEIVRLAREIEPGCKPRKLIADGGLISKYGSKDPYEFFAECFANSVCGKPNALGRAMAAFLERHIAGDGLKEKYRK